MTSELRTNWLLKHLANETQKEYVVSIGNEQKIGYKGITSYELQLSAYELVFQKNNYFC